MSRIELKLQGESTEGFGRVVEYAAREALNGAQSPTADAVTSAGNTVSGTLSDQIDGTLTIDATEVRVADMTVFTVDTVPDRR